MLLKTALTNSKSKSKLRHDRRSVGQSVLASSSHLGPKTRFILLSESCGFVDVGRRLWRQVYPLQLLLPLASVRILGTEFHGTRTYCLTFQNLPTWRARSLYLYPPGTGWSRYTPRHWVPLSLPPTTCRAALEIFEPASTLGSPETSNWSFL
jgi:hypothetical protein